MDILIGMVVYRNIATTIILILIYPNTEHQKHHWGIIPGSSYCTRGVEATNSYQVIPRTWKVTLR
jgi:hypothetical protein